MSELFDQIYKLNQLEFAPNIGHLYFYNEADMFSGKLLKDKQEKLEKILGERKNTNGF